MATPGLDAIIAMLAKFGFTNWINSTPTASSLPYINSSKELASSDAVTASKPVYINSSSVPVTGALPFAMPLAAGATDSSLATFDISGRATGTPNDLMHLNLVLGANATATIGGYYRVTITDAAGVITDGAYYAPFYVLS